MNSTIRRATLRVFLLALAAAALTGCGGAGSGPGSETSTFSKSYGGPLHDETRVVLNTEDGGFMLFGSADGDDLLQASDLPSAYASPRGGDFWLQKLDANGNIELGRTIGVRSAYRPGTTWKRARPTSDGGTILTGKHHIEQEITRTGAIAGETQTVVTTSLDVAVAKLDAGGNVVWSHSYDSGAWPQYDYFARNGELPAARDQGEDVWPMADGGFLVAGTSVANLADPRGIGFPCNDEELNAIAVRPCEDATPGTGSDRFTDAYSVVMLRLNADGSLRWQRRLTDNAYDTRGNSQRGRALRVLVRGTADEGAVLARGVDGGVLVQRLDANGFPMWRRAIGGMLRGELEAGDYFAPSGLIQTDDPVDGHDGDLHDGQRDDGFVLTGADRVIKLRADGSLQWHTNLGPAPPLRLSPSVFINDLTQVCDYGRPTRCDVIAVGRSDAEDDQGRRRFRGYAFFLGDDGDVRDDAFKTVGVADGPIFTLTRITAGTSSPIQLLGVDREGQLMLLEMVFGAPPLEPHFRNLRSGTLAGEDRERGDAHLPEFRPDGSVQLLTPGGRSLQILDPQAQLQSELNLVTPPGGEVLRAAVQIGPGRFVLAGTRRGASGQSGIVALRYDLDASGDRTVWQRLVVPDEDGDVLAAAPAGDGGVVLSFFTPGSEEQFDGRLLKLSADGHRQWQLALPGLPTELQRLPDGGFAALSLSSQDAVVTRVSPAGERLWQNRVSLGAGQGRVTALAATADGGLVLAGSVGPRLSLVRLAPDGALMSARDVLLPTDPGQNPFFADLRIREAADGSFVLAATEQGLLGNGPGAGAPAPRGQSNALVLKLDAALLPLWSHVYGARFNEGVRDLALRADGTIAVAGYSDSLGERREAWLLKLSPLGLISDGGCQALLGSIPADLVSTGARDVTVASSGVTLAVPAELPPFTDTNASLQTPQDFITARQCLGTASAGIGIAPGPTWRLSVLQVGNERGVVSSVPTGISCGTGLDICTADFAQGSRVALRADPNRFIAWRGDCDEDTGGTRLDCVIRLDRDRTIQVEFGTRPPPPPTARFTLSFAVQGQGFVRTADGINCGEGGSAVACSREYAAGTPVDVSAVPFDGRVFLGWSGEDANSPCLAFGRQTEVRITVDRNLRCFAQFGQADQRLLAITVAGNGVVRNQPGAAAINCREGGSQGDCQEIYTSAETVALLASPDAGWRFAGWGGDCADNGEDPGVTLLMAQGQACSAGFVPIATGATLTVIVNSRVGVVESQPTGIICSGGNGSDCSETYALGAVVLLRATPAGFLSWQGCDEVLDINACRVTMNQSRSVAANFSQ